MKRCFFWEVGGGGGKDTILRVAAATLAGWECRQRSPSWLWKRKRTVGEILSCQSFPAQDLVKMFQQLFFFLVCWTKNKKYEHMNWGRTLLSLCFFLMDADLILNSDVLEIVKNWKLNKHVEIESYVVIALMQEDRSYRELPPGCSTWSCRWGSHRGKGERRRT